MHSIVYPPASKPINLLTLNEKLLKIGRNVPCEAAVQSGNKRNKCPCLGWRPKINNTGRSDLCQCDHRVSWHGESDSLTSEGFNARLEIAMKIDDILESKNKLLDFDFEDAELKSLRRYGIFKIIIIAYVIREIYKIKKIYKIIYQINKFMFEYIYTYV